MGKMYKNVFSSKYRQTESECTGGSLLPDISVVFDIYPFNTGYMAYVEFKYKNNKLDRNERTLNGNSLWSIGKMSKEELINVINSYTNIEQIKQDFMC